MMAELLPSGLESPGMEFFTSRRSTGSRWGAVVEHEGEHGVRLQHRGAPRASGGAGTAPRS